MPKFIVTKCVDAHANYSTLIEAADAVEARDIAEQKDAYTDELVWHPVSVSEYDDADWGNIAPELVADDYQMDEPAEVRPADDKLREFAEMVARLTASGDEIAPDGDYCPNGFTHDTGDSLDALDSLIHKARELTGIAAKVAEFDWYGPEEGDECDESIWILNPDGDELFEVTSGDDVEANKEIARRMVAKINASADLRSRLTDESGLFDKIEAECAEVEEG